jgi:hypothetical protein
MAKLCGTFSDTIHTVTVGAAWIRQGRDGEELWIASDSRLTGDGNIWDDCPKILLLPRRDAAAAFSGSTRQAYPLLLQLANAIASYRAAADGTLEFFSMLGHLERVTNSMMGRLKRDAGVFGESAERGDFMTSGDSLILGGYSRAQSSLALRLLRFQGKGTGLWKFERVRPSVTFGPSRVIAVFGDNLSRSRFRYLLKLLLQERQILRCAMPLTFEPLEVISAMLRMPESRESRLPMGRRPWTIGGAPQIVRILPGAQATAFAVRWTDSGNSADYLQGRPTFGYERLDVPLVTFGDSGLKMHAPGQWPNL